MERKKDFFVIILVIISLFLNVGVVSAQTSAALSFGIRPTKALEGQEETYSYFSYRVAPETTFQDEALVMNDGDTPVTLKIYAADGVTARNGGTDFMPLGERSAGLSAGCSEWISLSTSEVILAPGEEQTVPFEVQIPAGVKAGQYVAGLVVEALPVEEAVNTVEDAAGEEAQFNVQVVRRVGVAVVMDVSGEQFSELEIGDIALYQQTEEGSTFMVELRNVGNAFLQAEGFFVVTDRSGEKLITTIPLDVDTILPGDTAVFYVERPARFADGKYLLSVLMSYGDKKATLEGIGMSIKNGQPEIEGAVQDRVFSAEEVEVFFEDPYAKKRTFWIIFGTVSLALALGIGGLVYWLGGRKEQKMKPKQTKPSY